MLSSHKMGYLYHFRANQMASATYPGSNVLDNLLSDFPFWQWRKQTVQIAPSKYPVLES
ncbi:hypothetical protein EB564_0001355 (plasmid) [Escherichia coli]|nr:hypothetical protein [Escherichia coli]